MPLGIDDNVPHKNHKLIKLPVPGMRNLKWLVRVNKMTPKTI